MPGDLDEVIVGGRPNGLTAVALSSAGMLVLMTQSRPLPVTAGR